MGIYMSVTERKNIHRHLLGPVKGNTAPLPYSRHMATFLHPQPESKVLNSVFTLSRLADEDEAGLVGLHKADKFLNRPGLPESPGVPS
jgi:hypothetical protein